MTLENPKAPATERRSPEKETQDKMKKILTIILTVAILATTAKAGLGWSLEECTQHYGKPEYTNSDPFTTLYGTISKRRASKSVRF
jgi:hypothetical protein